MAKLNLLAEAKLDMCTPWYLYSDLLDMPSTMCWPNKVTRKRNFPQDGHCIQPIETNQTIGRQRQNGLTAALFTLP